MKKVYETALHTIVFRSILSPPTRTHVMNTTISIDLGNNEELTRGVFENADGTFTALTFARSKEFKTKAGAIRWFKKMTGN